MKCKNYRNLNSILIGIIFEMAKLLTTISFGFIFRIVFKLSFFSFIAAQKC